jgi:hypothetical protein
MLIHHQRLDNLKKSRKSYKVQLYVHKCNAMARAIRIWEKIRREYVDKKAGKSYGLGSNDPAQKATDAMGDNHKKDEEKPPYRHCGKVDHSTTRSQHCTFTTYNLQAQGKKGKCCVW